MELLGGWTDLHVLFGSRGFSYPAFLASIIHSWRSADSGISRTLAYVCLTKAFCRSKRSFFFVAVLKRLVVFSIGEVDIDFESVSPSSETRARIVSGGQEGQPMSWDDANFTPFRAGAREAKSGGSLKRDMRGTSVSFERSPS